MKKQKIIRKILTAVAIAVVLIAVVIAAVFLGGKWFIGKEGQVRDHWEMDSTETLQVIDEYQIDINRVDGVEGLSVIQMIPQEIEEEGFTFYDMSVQERLSSALRMGKDLDKWTVNQPLAVLNPFGTASNALYFSFQTAFETKVEYTIHVENEEIEDFTKVAQNADGKKFSKKHEFQMIGLVPGEKNQVTVKTIGKLGRELQKLQFTIDMIDNHSDYPTKLEYTDGESKTSLGDGLFTMMRTNGHLGYGFLYDNDGIMRYEMVLEGYGLDRILFDGSEMITCVSNKKIARMNSIGQVLQIYELEGYELHHDIQFSGDHTIVALVNKETSDTIEDDIVEIDLVTGEVKELIDMSELMADYHEGFSRPIAPTDDFFWQVGEWDWLHLNTIDYMKENDSLLLSSRETNTIIKVENAHTAPEVVWLIGNPEFWMGTPYEDRVLAKEGDFMYQYGQHTVEYQGAGENGIYYIRLYNNNYYSLNSRDFEMEVEAGVGTDLYGADGIFSYVYVYKIDEANKKYSMETSFAVPYSSIVSNVMPTKEKNWVVNSGVANVFGEYDEAGNLIREFAYECELQGYRTMKYDYRGIWFQ